MRLPQLNSRQVIAGINSPSARSCSRTGSRSPSIARWQIRRASSSGLMLALPLLLGIIWRFGRSFQIEAIEHRGDLGELLDQRSNQAQEFLLLWPVARCNEEGSDLNVGDLAARRKIRLMPDEYPPSIGVVSEQPPVPVSAAVNLSSPNGHATLLSRSHRYQCASSCL